MKFIKFLFRSRLYPIPILLILYVILYFLGENVSYGSIPFAVLVIGVLVTVLYSIYRALFKKKGNLKKEREKERQSKEPKQTKKRVVYPIYFTVKQDPRYIFAEYEDRYELYLKTESGLKYVKTDVKQ